MLRISTDPQTLPGGISGCQSGTMSAKNLWEICAQAVQRLWVGLGQNRHLTHRRLAAGGTLWEKPGFLHGLYHFCTQDLPTYFYTFTPLLLGQLSTPSTGPTKTTTIYNK